MTADTQRMHHAWTLFTEQMGLEYDQHAMPLVWRYSEYIREWAARAPVRIAAVLQPLSLNTPHSLHHYTALLSAEFDADSSESDVAKALRLFRHQHSVRIAWRMLQGLADTHTVLKECSALAESILNATNHYVHGLIQKAVKNKDVEQQQVKPLCIIALGKLGGGELNFYSDCDIIFVYDNPQHYEFYNRCAKKIIALLAKPTEHGIVYHVDCRLRPYGESGRLVQSLPAMMQYYQQQARPWERYAMVKARVLGEPGVLATHIQQVLTAFTYRRYIDFTIIDGLRSLKQLINQERNTNNLTQNIKKGFGGIREIEFSVQTFQIIRGGQLTHCQTANIYQALSALQKYELYPESIINTLKHHYNFFRDIENRLQARACQQTHDLPSDAAGQTILAESLGFNHWQNCQQAIDAARNAIAALFTELLQVSEPNTISAGISDDELSELWIGRLDAQTAIDLLESLGIKNATIAYEKILQFSKSTRIKRLNDNLFQDMNRVVLSVLKEAGRQHISALALENILNLLQSISSKLAYVVLLRENPNAVLHLIKLCDLSYWIANQLTCNPFLLSELLQAEKLYEPLPEIILEKELDEHLNTKHSVEHSLDALVNYKARQWLRVASAEVTQQLPLMKASDHLSFSASVMIRRAQALVEQDLQFPYHDNMAIIAYGKLGGLELSYASDLDLVFLHDLPKTNDQLTRFVKRLVHYMQTQTFNGNLFTVDTRLRPSGSSGLLISSINEFSHYQQQQAWTWEHQALIRARCISGNETLQKKFEDIRLAILSQSRDLKKLKNDIVAMREKIQNTKGKNSIRTIKGGIIDLEFLMQYAVLAHANQHPILARFTDNMRIIDAAVASSLLSKEHGEQLQQAYLTFRAYSHHCILNNKSDTLRNDELFNERQHVIKVWNQWMGDLG